VSPMSHQRAERPDGTVEWCDASAAHACRARHRPSLEAIGAFHGVSAAFRAIGDVP
jgi:hypothetical protein